MTKIRCPKCEHIVGEVDGERITTSVATRGRGRREITAWSKAEFRCDDCGHLWLFQTTDAARDTDAARNKAA